jgi:hypothetical protein
MSYRVVWDAVAYRKLERIWTEADDIGPTLHAFDEVEALLQDEPEQQGESRARGRRILIVPPLGVVFRVQPRLGEVYVLDAWVFGRKK